MARPSGRCRPALAYYINGHGFGHATRSIAILNALWRESPGRRVLIRTDAPDFLFRKSCEGPYRLLPGTVDPGTIQADPLHLDRNASVEARARWHRELPRRVAAERALLAEEHVGLIAGDIPPLAFETASTLDVPSVALGNFSWDWIFEPYLVGSATGEDLLAAMRGAYRRADLLLRMPLHGEMTAFREVEDIPHVVRPSRAAPATIRRALGVREERRPLVLVSFGGFAAVRFREEARPDPGPFRFVTFGEGLSGLPGDTVRLPVNHAFRHEDLVAAADAVIMKPGYGTIAECLTSRTPFLYTSRDDFREYGVLVQGVRERARCRFVPREDLLSLCWRQHLEVLLSDRRPWAPVRTGGAAAAAARLLELLEGAGARRGASPARGGGGHVTPGLEAGNDPGGWKRDESG
ncbi:MAG: hypothetical protein PVF68_03790 [Acidobacteriota bacterium]|jgi:L-arabinokinase